MSIPPTGKIFREATWDEALDFAADGLKSLRKMLEASVAGFGSAKCTNEGPIFSKIHSSGVWT